MISKKNKPDKCKSPEQSYEDYLNKFFGLSPDNVTYGFYDPINVKCSNVVCNSSNSNDKQTIEISKSPPPCKNLFNLRLKPLTDLEKLHLKKKREEKRLLRIQEEEEEWLSSSESSHCYCNYFF